MLCEASLLAEDVDNLLTQLDSLYRVRVMLTVHEVPGQAPSSGDQLVTVELDFEATSNEPLDTGLLSRTLSICLAVFDRLEWKAATYLVSFKMQCVEHTVDREVARCTRIWCNKAELPVIQAEESCKRGPPPNPLIQHSNRNTHK